MLAAHSAGFTDSGLISMLAGLLLSTSLCSLTPRAASVVVWAHVSLWFLSFAEVAAAFWGTTKLLRIAGAQAGATGGAPWQEATVIICHAIPALVRRPGDFVNANALLRIGISPAKGSC
jgi:hypothetical protein